MSALKAVALMFFLAQLSQLLGHPAICGKWVLVRNTHYMDNCQQQYFEFLDDIYLLNNESRDSVDQSFEGSQNTYDLKRVDDYGRYIRVNTSSNLNIQTYKNIMTIGASLGVDSSMVITMCYIQLSLAMSVEDERALNETCPLQPKGPFSETPNWRECLEMYNQRSNN